MTEDERRAVADQLRALLALIDRGELQTSALTRARIEGAVAALDLVAGVDPAEVLRRLTDPD